MLCMYQVHVHQKFVSAEKTHVLQFLIRLSAGRPNCFKCVIGREILPRRVTSSSPTDLPKGAVHLGYPDARRAGLEET